MQRESDAFDAALERPEQERESFVRERYASDPELVRRVLRLIEAHGRAERDGLDAENVEVRTAAMPEVIGAYRIVERIGEGGMGVVYAAEQSQPIRRQVAIKVLKLGMDTEEVLLRFEAERQAMALMDHPGIAKVLDAGASSEGSPYFVMELVEGQTLTQYCADVEPSLKAKLALFMSVCEAVHHAHQRGIIHRDLKPSNILVTERDGSPAPKVIDFGIAKATAAQLTEQTFFTEHGRLVGTPEYMSPEQTGVPGVDVDIRSDVFSLGVILYELITGVLPIKREDLRRGSQSDVFRQIREVDPERPSTRLQTVAPGEASGAKDRPNLARTIRGELDWIVMRAIEKDRSRRYASASELREDVERYLTDRPVLARPPKVSYVVQKYVKRHRFATALVLLVLVSTLVGLAGLMVGIVRANRAEALATHRANNAQAAAAFLEKVLFQADPEVLGSESQAFLSVLANAGAWIEDELGDNPEVEASVRESIGVAFRRKSMYPDAEPHLVRSLKLRRAALGDSHLETASACIAVADLRFESAGAITESLGLLRGAERVLAAHRLGDTRASAWLQLDIGLVELAGDRLALAEEAFQRCRTVFVRDRGERHADVSRPLRGLAQLAVARGDLETAENFARSAEGLCQDWNDRYLRARSMLILAEILIEKGETDEAERLLEEVGAVLEATVGDRHIRIAERFALVSRLEFKRGRFAAASKAAERCEVLRAELLDRGHWSTMEARLLRVEASLGAGDPASASRLLEELEVTPAQGMPLDHPLMIHVARVQQSMAQALGDAAMTRSAQLKVEALRSSRAARLGG